MEGVAEVSGEGVSVSELRELPNTKRGVSVSEGPLLYSQTKGSRFFLLLYFLGEIWEKKSGVN